MTSPTVQSGNSSRPVHVGIVIFDDVEVLDFAGPFEVFTVAGQLQGADSPNTENVAIRAFTIAQSDRLVHARGNLLIQPHYTIENHPALDVIVVPGGWGTRREVNNPILMDWLRKVCAATPLITSVCT